MLSSSNFSDNARCLECNSSLSKLLDIGFPLAKCLSCGITYSADWSEKFDQQLYDYYADRIALDPELFSNLATEKSLSKLLDQLSSLVSGRRLLDVGCGEGQVVKAALEAGWDAFGIDLSKSAIEICKSKFSLPCESIDMFSDQLSGPFDIVIMSEFIEHVPRPSRFFQRARQLLCPGGYLYITTPNFNSFPRRAFGAEWRAICSEHISYFSPRTLREVLIA